MIDVVIFVANFFARARLSDKWMHMKACRGAGRLGWAALLVGVVVGGSRGADGDFRWAFTTDNTGNALVHSSPTVGPDGTVYFGVEVNTSPPTGRVFAVDREGNPKWRFDAPDWVDSSPAISADGTTVYFGCWDGKLYAREAATGKKKWEFSAGIFVLGSPAVGRDGTIYFGGGDSAFHAVSSSGVAKWSYPVGENFVESSPAIGADGSVYFGSGLYVYALDADGILKWRVPTGGRITSSSPAIGADGTIYIGSLDSRVYAISSDGATRWTFSTEGQVSASPVLGADGTIYIGGEDSYFYAINPDGTKKWKVSVGGPIVSSAAVRSDGAVIFGADDSVVRALDPAGGLVKWAKKTGDIIESSPVVAPDGTVYVGSLDGKLYSYAGSGAAASGYSRWPMFRRDPLRGGAAPAIAEGGRLVNLSTRAQAGDGTTLIAGLVTQGAVAKNYLIRAVGPTLESEFGVVGPLRDPTLALHVQESGAVLLANDDWGTAANAAQLRSVSTSVGAFALPEGSKDSVVLGGLDPGAYTAVLQSADGGSGVALVEAYDAEVTSSGTRLVNLSTRAQVGTGNRVLIAGFVVSGTDPVRFLVRAVGPKLADFGVTGVLARPTMEVFSGANSILTNTGWSSTVFRGDVAGAAVVAGAFALADGSADCAALLTLNPGNYTIQVSGVSGTTGEALAEIYRLP